jgi:purine-binding chemotaxis protein CheW
VYGVEIRNVTEIIGVQHLTRLPEVPDYIKGIINLRWKIIPAIDIRLKFRKEAIDYNDRTCMIIIEMQDLSIGLIVDSVSEVMAIRDEEIIPPPEHAGAQNRYIFGVVKSGDNVKLLIDCNKLFREEEEDIIEDMRYDGKHSYEDTICTVEESYQRWGGRIGIMGGIDMDFICRSSIEEIQRRAQGMLALSAGKGGYALGTGNSVPEYIDDEKYFAMISVATGLKYE